jgi:hypothetical protein
VLEIHVFFAMAASLDFGGTLKTEASQEIIEGLVTRGKGALGVLTLGNTYLLFVISHEVFCCWLPTPDLFLSNVDYFKAKRKKINIM